MQTEENRVRIEKYITGIVSKNKSKLYTIYANPEQMHILISRAPGASEEEIATIIANSSERFVNENKLTPTIFHWQQSASGFSMSKLQIERVGNTFFHSRNTIRNGHYLIIVFGELHKQNRMNRIPMEV